MTPYSKLDFPDLEHIGAANRSSVSWTPDKNDASIVNFDDGADMKHTAIRVGNAGWYKDDVTVTGTEKFLKARPRTLAEDEAFASHLAAAALHI